MNGGSPVVWTAAIHAASDMLEFVDRSQTVTFDCKHSNGLLRDRSFDVGRGPFHQRMRIGRTQHNYLTVNDQPAFHNFVHMHTPFGQQGFTGDHIDFMATHLRGCKVRSEEGAQKLIDEVYKKAFRDAMFLKEPSLIDWSVIFTYAPWDERMEGREQRNVHKLTGCFDGREWGLQVGIIDVAEHWDSRRSLENLARRTLNTLSQINPLRRVGVMDEGQRYPYLYGTQKWKKYWGRSTHMVQLLLEPLLPARWRLWYASNHWRTWNAVTRTIEARRAEQPRSFLGITYSTSQPPVLTQVSDPPIPRNPGRSSPGTTPYIYYPSSSNSSTSYAWTESDLSEFEFEDLCRKNPRAVRRILRRSGARAVRRGCPRRGDTDREFLALMDSEYAPN